MNMKGREIYRAVILMPWVIAPMVMAANWLWLLNDQFGLINHVLMELKIIEKPILFLTTRYMSRFTVTMIGVWKNLPFMTITLLAGMKGIPGELYEAARIDGGGKIKSFLYIDVYKRQKFVWQRLCWLCFFSRPLYAGPGMRYTWPVCRSPGRCV